MNKLIIFFMIFGCWVKDFYGVLPSTIYNIWLVIITFWIILNACAVVGLLFKPKYKDLDGLKRITRDTMDKWAGLSLLAFTSYMFCGETLVALLFLFFPGAFLVYTALLMEKLEKKKKSK